MDKDELLEKALMKRIKHTHGIALGIDGSGKTKGEREREQRITVQNEAMRLEERVRKLEKILWELEQRGHPCECIHCEKWWNKYREERGW